MPADIVATDARDLSGRLALGTVQFGLDYGINNTAGRPDDATVAEILHTAQAAGITLLDTASAYGDSETRLGHWLSQAQPEQKPFELVTKLAAGPAGHVWHALQTSLKRLRQPSVYGVLFHQFAGFRDKPAAWEVLCDAQTEGLVQRIGVSLYHPEEAEWLLANPMGVSLVQLPFNVLDQRFGPLLPALQQAGIEVHVRSAFLQGLLLRDPVTLPAFFAPLAPKIRQLRALAQRAGIPLASLLLLFAAYAPGVARAVIGVDTAANLRENLAAGAYTAPAEQLRPELQQLAEETTKFILPYTWPPRS
ncbi:aldo/keto reductase [Hymenobacter properus]|uniref:Aldo/keto reductase n=1 Tax=Hymenobacter properus TaxID=2791026 RepID=A0A931BM52_9BACT|nr:aldo/keto reductase [Hymenobacter properus]MBF9143947.1 aldo/keto reductase [Hymenobacter properus]MBR7722762.1 aldo/keto reductase [Microvirga sp. SRT04]